MSPLRPLYSWILKQAEKPYVDFVLFFIAFIEPCFIPIPPDLLLIPTAIAQRHKAYRLALVATVGSVLGGIVGYGIGALAMATIGDWIVHTYHLENAFERFRAGFQRYGMWIILAKGLTPIPFILVTVASGVTHLNLIVFILSASLTRGGRFFLEAALIRRFGEPIQIFIEKYLNLVALAVLALFLLGFWFVLRS